VLLVVWLDSWRHFLVCIVIWYKHKVTNKMWNKWKLKEPKMCTCIHHNPYTQKGYRAAGWDVVLTTGFFFILSMDSCNKKSVSSVLKKKNNSI
jgi:hypothetical protein